MFAIETQDKQFHDGNGTTELGTILPAWWLNQVQDELLTVLQAANIAPNKATSNQLAQAINTIAHNILNGRGNDFCPSGMIMTFAGDFAPVGWLKANGAAVSRTAYAKLFAAIGTRYGAGDGHSAFNLPDLRGEFLRFWDDLRGVDAGRGLGTWQNDAIRNIAGNAATYTQDDIRPNGVLGISNKATRGIVWENNWQNFGIQAQLDFDASRVVPTANENRPRNIALLACIKI